MFAAYERNLLTEEGTTTEDDDADDLHVLQCRPCSASYQSMASVHNYETALESLLESETKRAKRKIGTSSFDDTRRLAVCRYLQHLVEDDMGKMAASQDVSCIHTVRQEAIYFIQGKMHTQVG